MTYKYVKVELRKHFDGIYMYIYIYVSGDECIYIYIHIYMYMYIYIYVFETEKITQFYVTFPFTAFPNNNFTGHVKM